MASLDEYDYGIVVNNCDNCDREFEIYLEDDHFDYIKLLPAGVDTCEICNHKNVRDGKGYMFNFVES